MAHTWHKYSPLSSMNNLQNEKQLYKEEIEENRGNDVAIISWLVYMSLIKWLLGEIHIYLADSVVHMEKLHQSYK